MMRASANAILVEPERADEDITNPNRKISLRRNRFPILFGVLIALGVAVPTEAANDPKDLASQNGKDASVNQSTGQAHFRIEIPVPKGTGGSEPDLALTYSSNLSDGPFGVGWDVELGEIRRTARFGTPAYDSTDQFEFDGVLLVEDLSNPGEYRTLQESFARITRSVSGVEDHWLVEFPDGRKARFGMDQTTRIRMGGSLAPENDTGEIGRWLLSELEDVNGNITRFAYDRSRDVGTAYPRSITYTFREGEEAPVGGARMKRRIQFVLEARTDEIGRDEVIYGFPLGIETRIGDRVSEIISSVGNDVYRRMILTYAGSAGYATGRSRLESVQLFGTNCQSNLNPATKCQGLPAKTFTYTESDAIGTGTGAQWDPNAVWHGGISLHFTQGSGKNQGRDRGVRIGDVNGDGYPDYIGAWAKAVTDDFGRITHQIGHEVFLSDGSGWGVSDANWKAALQALRVTVNLVEEVRISGRETCSTRKYSASDFQSYLFFRWENPFHLESQGYPKLINPPIEAKLVDLNGDGFSDIVVSFEVGAGSSTAASRCGSASWDAPVEVKHVFINNGIGDPSNGGGWTDETADWADSLPLFYSIYLRSDAGTGRDTPGVAWTPGVQRGNSNDASIGVTYAYFLDHGVRMPDLNGDGRPDIVAKRDPATFGSGSSVITFEDGAWLSDPDGVGWVRHDEFIPPTSIVAEFNYFQALTSPTERPKYVHDADAGVRFADLNGDGLADLVKTGVDPISEHGPLSATLLEEGVWLNTGAGWCGTGEGNAGCDAAQKYIPPTGFTTLSAVYQPPALTWGGGNLPLVRSSELRFVDLNGDGLVDLLKTDDVLLTGLNAWIHDPSEPGIWVQDDRYIPDEIMATTGRHKKSNGNLWIFDDGVRIYDYNGDATVDLMRDESQAARKIHISRTAHVDLLETFDNGQGGIQTLEYTSAIKQRDETFELYAEIHAGPSYANEIDFIGLPRWTARPIVSKITTKDTLAGGTEHVTTMLYAMPQWDPDNRSLLGFRAVSSTRDDGSLELTYIWQQPGRTGRPNWVMTYEGGDLRRQQTMAWEVVPGSDAEGSITGVNIGRLTEEKSVNFYGRSGSLLEGSKQTVSYEYSDGVSPYGYNFVHKITATRPTGNLIIKRVPDLTDRGVKWIKGKLAKETHEDKGSELLKQTAYLYDDRGLPTSVTRTIKQRYLTGAPTLAITAYLFDEFGNLIRTSDPEGRITYFCYDGDTNFADSSACQDGMRTGTHTVVVSIKDPLGEKTSFSGEPMDLAFGRLTTIDRLYSGDSDWVDVDAFNRPIRRWAKPAGQNQKTILATREYIDDPFAPDNLAGRPFIIERSYFDKSTAANDAAAVRTANYVDGFGRQRVSVSPTAPLAAYPFGRAITARDHAGRPTRGTLDIACTDDDCTNLAEATYPNVEEIVQTYDALGRVLTRTTPDGVMAFAYDQTDYTPPAGLGSGTSVKLDVVLSKNANGVLTEHLLDGDRVVVANECDEVDPGLTDLSRVTCSNADSTFYTYEATGELESIYDATNDYGSVANRLTYRYDTLGRVYSIEDPDGGMTFTVYDKVGNIRQTTNISVGDTTKVIYEYDALDRMKVRNAPDQLGDWDLSVTYDPNTRKRATVTSSGSYSEIWEYDDFGNLQTNKRTMNARTLRTDFQYDLLGRLMAIQSPLETTEGVSYGYDGAYLTRVCGNLEISDCEGSPGLYYVDGVQYDALGRVMAISEAPGDLKFDYYTIGDEEAGRAVHRVKLVKLDNDGSKLNLAYQYNDGGQIIQVTDAHTAGGLTATAAYAYDQRGRLLSWTAEHHSNVSKYFVYDELGNLVGRDLDDPDDDWNQFYYDGESENLGEGGPHAIATNHKGKSYTYDGAGNVTQRGSEEYITYNSLGQIYCVGATENTCGAYFWYDIDGGLLSKTVGSTSEIYLGDYFRLDKGANIAWTYTSAFGRHIVMEKKTGVSLRAAWAPPVWWLPIERDLFFQRLAAVALIGVLALLAWLGAFEAIGERPATVSVALVLSVIIAAPPQAWGMGRRGGGGGGGAHTYTRYLFHDHLGSNVLALKESGLIVERRVFEPFGEVVASQIDSDASVQTSFTGKLYHDELSLYHFGARGYDSEAGRFLSIDPILQSVPDPQTHNPYGYARNNPIGNIDPDGREFRGSSGSGAQLAITFWVGAFNSFFGAGSKNSRPPRPPNGPPVDGDRVAAGNAASGSGASTQGFGESTAKKYGGESQSSGSEAGRQGALSALANGLAIAVGRNEITSLEALAQLGERAASFGTTGEEFVNDLGATLSGTSAANVGDPTGAVPFFTASGFRSEFQDTGNQVRHFTGALVAGARFGWLGGQALNTGREIFSPAGARSMADVRLGNAAVRLGAGLASGRVLPDQFGAIIRRRFGVP